MPRFLLIFAIVFFSFPSVGAAPAREAYLAFKAGAPNRDCHRRLDSLEEFRLLFSLSAFRAFLKNPEKGSFRQSVKSWSSDLILKTTLQLTQEYEPMCSEPRVVAKVVAELRDAFLEIIGVEVASYSDADLRILFKGLAVEKDDVSVIREKVIRVVDKRNVLSLLSQVYGGEVGNVRGVIVLNGSSKSLATMEKWIEAVCAVRAQCRFWDTRLINRVVISQGPGIAAFVPELGVLVVSKELVENPVTLHQFVFVHELAHIAERSRRVYDRDDDISVFADFSGWSRRKGHWTVSVVERPIERLDDLSSQSRSSSFTILPDPLVLSKASKADGFVVAKAYRESLHRNDPAEDYADHIAAYYVLPERFCAEGKPLAPRKFEWISKTFGDGKVPTTSCLKTGILGPPR